MNVHLCFSSLSQTGGCKSDITYLNSRSLVGNLSIDFVLSQYIKTEYYLISTKNSKKHYSAYFNSHLVSLKDEAWTVGNRAEVPPFFSWFVHRMYKFYVVLEFQCFKTILLLHHLNIQFSLGMHIKIWDGFMKIAYEGQDFR